ncbi:MAG: hypothetical protein R3F62_12670 [Planctomycetota bacterium]
MEWLCAGIVALGLPAFVVWAVLKYRRDAARERGLAEALLDFAAKQGWEQTQGVGSLLLEFTGSVLGERCFVRLGWQGSDYALVLRVDVPDQRPSDFTERWERRWTRYVRRGFEDLLRATYDVRWVRLVGPAHSLRDTFAELGPEAMATLFVAPREGRGGPHHELRLKQGVLSLSTSLPGAEALARLPARLEALVRLSRSGSRALEADPGPPEVAPRTVGTVPVRLQAEQHCAYCREQLAGATARELKTCAACQATLHAECLAEHGGCCTAGCRNNPHGRRDVRPSVRG